MTSWLLDFVPWWLWVALLGGVALATLPWWLPAATAIWKLMPSWLRFTLGGFAAAFIAYVSGRQAGRKAELDRQKQRDARAEAARKETDKKVEGMTPDQRSKERKRWEDH